VLVFILQWAVGKMKKIDRVLEFFFVAPALCAAGPASPYDERFAFTKDYIQTLGIFKGIETAAEALRRMTRKTWSATASSGWPVPRRQE
jgi:hypothetical protein